MQSTGKGRVKWIYFGSRWYLVYIPNLPTTPNAPPNAPPKAQNAGRKLPSLPGPGPSILILSCDWRSSRIYTGSGKLLTPSALADTAFVQRTAFPKTRLLRATICSRATHSFLCSESQKRRARAHRSGLRTSCCERIAAAALQLSRALQQ